MSAPPFVHLHVHTEYSLADGLLRIDDYADALAAAGMPAAAVTELYNTFSMVKFYRKCLERGIKPVIGAEINLADAAGANQEHRLVLLCLDQGGYRNLTKLISHSYTREKRRTGPPLVLRDFLERHAGGLAALSGAGQGEIGRLLVNDDYEQAGARLVRFMELFEDRFYLEIQRTERPGEDACIDGSLALAAEYGAPLAATNDVRFLRAEDFETHEARVCIQAGTTLADPRRPRDYSREQYLKTPEQMAALFHDIPEALANAAHLAERCNLEITLGEHYLPNFSVPDGFDQAGWLRRESEQGLERFIEERRAGGVKINEEEYRQRLGRELDVINDMQFPGYFLIVADFIRWAKKHGIPVGPGRGSGGGSLAAYALGITDLDPIEHELLFERFLNPARASLPDFDVDFCMNRRDEVIRYVFEHYGEDYVSHIITYGAMKAKAAVRDAGRVLGQGYGFVDGLARLVPDDLDMTLGKALQGAELKRRYDEEEETRILIDLAQKLEGLKRNASKHAGGIIIAPRPLVEFMPLYQEKKRSDIPSTQFDMGDAEAVGLVKFDFLGLRTLTIIDWAVKDVNALLLGEGQKLSLNAIPLDDEAAYKTIQRADTTAVFQLEKPGIRKVIKPLRPDRFTDLVALLALYRPGPLNSGMVDDFIERKHGRAAIKYPHPSLEPVLRPTHGVILYQEQVMQIAQSLGGYAMAEADLLRRAMGKKKPEEMARQREAFVAGAMKNGASESQAASIFSLMEKFSGYGFNKSHSVGYALLTYQTAWLKTHYPAPFMAAVCSAHAGNADEMQSFREEAKRMGLTLRPPSVNASEVKFKVLDEKTILFGLGAVKGVGQGAMRLLVEEREKNGPFADLFDFCLRLDTRRINREVIKHLALAGALDDFGQSRSVLLASLEKALGYAEQCAANAAAGQDDLFGLEEKPDGGAAPGGATTYVAAPDWDDETRLLGEKATLGYYLAGHPINRYEKELSSLVSTRLGRIKADTKLRVAGYIENIERHNNNRGRMAELTLDDNTGRVKVKVYNEIYERCQGLLAKDRLVLLKGEAVADEYYKNRELISNGVAITAREICTLGQLRERFGSLRLKLNSRMLRNGAVAGLKEALARHANGTSAVIMEYNNDEVSTVMHCGGDWTVKISDELLRDLASVIGSDNISPEFPRQVNW